MEDLYEIRVSAAGLPERIDFRADLVQDLEEVVRSAGGGEVLGTGSWLSMYPTDPEEPGGWEIDFQVRDVDRAVAALIRRLIELEAPSDTVVIQSGPEFRVHPVYPPEPNGEV